MNLPKIVELLVSNGPENAQVIYLHFIKCSIHQISNISIFSITIILILYHFFINSNIINAFLLKFIFLSIRLFLFIEHKPVEFLILLDPFPS